MEWKISQGLVAYPDALSVMESRVSGILAGEQEELVWFLEHPPLYTAGTSAKDADLLDTKIFPVYAAGRGGEYTYHGPGQRVAYVLLDLKKRQMQDLKRFVTNMERWMIAALARLGVEAFTCEGRIGVWVKDGASESKIGAIGIRVRKWVTFHGISLNVHPDLSHYAGIVPCGISGFGVTSLKAMGIDASMEEVDKALKAEFSAAFR